ncbi:HD-GYP domain-containing protein [Clostridium magnum]|uniref:Response regulator PleD n=1 Tax=Clostridium magnum DSM 2767 TaxID=1121326 RepID=A0A162R5H8_9CLOT|nr:diguanylate cyclase [Clostridium magnum]KZL89457.1 response regulator PleD [Clostridium magnum DSM 2767]SHI20217.1 diguanylate cyclase (GGDEF) domain-containing protein [Clostridium magnum DSM 2767]
MNKIISNRQKKVFEIVSIVKLICLLFCGIIVFNYFFRDKNIIIMTNNDYLNVIPLGVGTLVIALIYIIWMFFSTEKLKFKNSRLLQITEDLIFILIFSILIVVSEAHESQYKLLFLFIVITSTIQSGIKQGMVVSTISSMTVLGIDLIYGDNTNVNQHFENDLILCSIFILTAWLLGYYVKIEKEYTENLTNLANIDGLTEVYNHRFFHDALKKILEKADKEKSPVSLIFTDIDYFKHYNDLYGHQKGDEVLRTIGFILKSSVRAGDIVARYGGEEFAIILPNTSEKDCLYVAERIRTEVERWEFEGEENQPNGQVTISLGVATFPDKASNEIELVKSSDDALYRAKFFNKNRVETYYSVLEELKKDIEAEHIDLITSIKTLISVINIKDRYTYGHVERVVMFAKLLGNKLGLTEEEMKTLKYGAYLHDIGKINISKDVLNKKMRLTDDEWEMLKQHPANGVDLIKPVESLKQIIPLILHHHERYDGRGYPSGLKGNDISYLTRILTVVDSFDAMTSNRPYSNRKTYEDAIEELRRCSGTQFDSKIAEAFIEVVQENKDKFDNLTLFSEK